jgi:DNA transformation protein
MPVGARDTFAAYCTELLAPLGAARSKRMFGGHGLYIDALFVAIVVGEQLYLKVDAETRAAFERAGSRPFI